MKQAVPSIQTPLHAAITIPGSKSISNRALLLAALADGVSEITNLALCDDTHAMMQALHQLGIVVQLDEVNRSCIIAGCSGQFPRHEANIYCDKAGTVARFLLAACASSAGTFHFDADPQLCARPIEPLVNTLVRQGAKIIPEKKYTLPFTMIGANGLKGGAVEIDAAISGQFVSALLMAAPFAKSLMKITALHLVSEPYVNMTCQMMKDFGVLVRRVYEGNYAVPVPQRYFACDYIVEPDLSTASYFFAAAAITGGEVTIQSIDRDKTTQADVLFITVLEKMGCIVTQTEHGLRVKGPVELRGINVDMRNFPDSLMTLAVIAPFASSPTTMTNIAHARHKESNRIFAMKTELEKLKIKVEEGPDWIKIFPSTPVANEITSYHDHRIAMAFTVMGLRVPGIVIDNAECVSKSCPEFFKLWEQLVNVEFLPPQGEG